MISVKEAKDRILALARPVGTEQVGLSEALGRVLATDVAARVSHPPAAVSAMDGYAVKAADVASAPVTLRVIGQSAAGHPFPGTMSSGETVRIFTGAVLPEGADAVVMQEDTESGGTTVRMTAEAARTTPGRYVRPRGLDFNTGEVLLKAGRVLSFRDIGLAAAMNVPWLRVARRPRIAVLSTGDEVVYPGDPLAPGQIPGANGLALSAFIAAAGCVPLDLGIALDDRDSLRTLAAGAAGADMLVSSGGVSVGDHDLIQEVLGEIGLKVDFWRVAVRPGKPLVFGTFGQVPLLGLPGNPVSAMVGAVLFLSPFLRVLQGLPAHSGPNPTALLGRDLPANDSREDYLRAILSRDEKGQLIVHPFELQDSAMMARLADADCLAIRPPLAPPAPAGTPIEIIPLTSASF
ncbi:MAG: gephyrin-like molybdotransferase Glp [Alphaproteobacteria bacterium]